MGGRPVLPAGRGPRRPGAFREVRPGRGLLKKPSPAARALFGGAEQIERVDRLVQRIASQLGLANPHLDETVALVDARLRDNRMEAQPLAA